MNADSGTETHPNEPVAELPATQVYADGVGDDFPEEEIDAAMILDILGDLNDSSGQAWTDTDAFTEGVDGFEESKKSDVAAPKKTGRKAGVGNKSDILTLETFDEHYSYTSVLRRGTDLEKMVVRFVMEQDPVIEETAIEDVFSFEEIVKALRKCLHMDEYKKSHDLDVRNRFGHISQRAQRAGKSEPKNAKTAKKPKKQSSSDVEEVAS